MFPEVGNIHSDALDHRLPLLRTVSAAPGASCQLGGLVATCKPDSESTSKNSIHWHQFLLSLPKQDSELQSIPENILTTELQAHIEGCQYQEGHITPLKGSEILKCSFHLSAQKTKL
ncbi:hypothetical protein H1C71_041065 [Ictidomys tridecemlineatus]|nr:hypothetical protein H1C71_041065 [Ictidomys tridecemlineatus]